MCRRKSYLLFAAIAGALSVAEAVAVVLVAQVNWATAGPLTVGLVVFALLLWTVLLATVLVVCASHLFAAGILEACSRVDAARTEAHVALLSARPTIELLNKALRRQEAPLGELRDSLLACAVSTKPTESASTSTRLARAAGLAAGVLRMSTEALRIVAALDDWVAGASARQDELVARLAELRDRLESLSAPASEVAESPDPVFGYRLTKHSPDPVGEDRADLPEAILERMRGSSPRWRDDCDPGRN